MSDISEAWITSPIGSYFEVVNGELKPRPPTWKERIADIPYNVAYYVSYPFIWLLRELWHGLRDAWETIFDE